MKVKVFDYRTRDVDKLESDINNFILDKKVIDIRASTAGENCDYWHLVIILYE